MPFIRLAAKLTPVAYRTVGINCAVNWYIIWAEGFCCTSPEIASMYGGTPNVSQPSLPTNIVKIARAKQIANLF